MERGGVRWMLAAVLAGAMLGGTVRGAEVTDEQVMASMRKGVDFLLSKKKPDATWEIGNWPQSWDQEKGGETALVVYALLHAGESMQDDQEYNNKLKWRSKEMLPSVEWLEKNMVGATYVAGLEASALTLLPNIKGQKPGEGPQAALDSVKYYLLSEMGVDGGYTYPKELRADQFLTLWEAWYTGKDAASKNKLDAFVKNTLGGSFAGPNLAIQKLVSELRAKAKANAADAARVEAELKALESYVKSMPQPESYETQLAAQKKTVADLENHARTGNLKFPDPKNPKQTVTITKEELNDRLEKARDTLQSMMEDKKKKFNPLGDLSNGQYGTLGAWAIADWGIELPDEYWEVTDRFWRLTQKEDGAWPYNPKSGKNVGDTEYSMGVAGIASLFIAQEFVDTELRLTPKPDKNIEAGLAWLDKQFKPDGNNLYYMYGVERVGLSSGLKFFGTANWYKEGAADIVKRQAASGSWNGNFPGGNDPCIATSYALLFLARGRNPVLFNKLQYNGPWNARPRDDAYATRWMSKQVEKPLNWQIVNLQVKPEEWQDAPILLITGSVDPKFTSEDVDKLRAFVNAGGMIFSTADGGKTEFTAAMKKYASQVVNKKYEMRQLPKGHELFDKDIFYKGTGTEIRNLPPLMGMSNGVRELWIHSPVDLGADWQMRKYASDCSFELGRALYYYASGKASLRSKLQPLAVEDGGAAARTVAVARVDYAGNSDPEPGEWARLAKVAKAEFKTDVKVETVKFADLDAKKYPLAHLTGTTKVTFTDDDAKALKAYLDAGGMLFADAAGGNGEFAASCRELIKKVYPEQELALLPPDHPIYTGSMADGVKIDAVDFRSYGMMKLQRRVLAPALQGIVVGERTPVVFSAWDVCSGFLGTSTWGIVGYGPKTAKALGRNIVLYAGKAGAAVN